MVEIYCIGDESDNYGIMETNIPIEYLKLAISKHLESVTSHDLHELIIDINKQGYKAAKKDILYLHLPGEIKNYDKKMDLINEKNGVETVATEKTN